MNVLNRVGGALLLLGLGIAVIIGFQSPTGRQFWDGIWQAGSTIVDYARTQILRLNGTSVAGDWRAAIGIVAVVLILLFIVLKKPISFRLFTTLLVLGVVAAFILYNPSVVS